MSGKRGVTFNRNASFSGMPMKLPCGQCIGCRLERSRQWAIRCLHENKLHDASCFVTLTYNDEHLPKYGTLVKRDLQLFVKRLHNRLLKSRGVGIRFYACGEYGDKNWRPHYHLIIFGWEPDDAVWFGVNQRGEKIFTSKYLAEVWPKGFSVFGGVTFDSAAYVARYVMKKVSGENAREYYETVDPETGEVLDMVPEFTNMSRRPGIGSAFFEKYKDEIYRSDSVIVNTKEVRPPRFYDVKMAALDEQIILALKEKRRRKAIKFRKDNTVDRLRVREVVQLHRLKLLERKV